MSNSGGESSTAWSPGSNEGAPRLHVLGIAQDGGVPHIGCRAACCEPAWSDPTRRRHAACAALTRPSGDGQGHHRWLIDATPDLRWQLRHLDAFAPAPAAMPAPALDGILLTHAHFGHIAGLAELGREALGARGVPVWAMPELLSLLRENAPWSRLIADGVIQPRPLLAGRDLDLGGGIRVTPVPVPHRTALSETVAFRIDGPRHSALWLPDLDAWDDEQADPHALVSSVDRAYVDGSFFDLNELSHRDRSRIAHPPIRATLALSASWPLELRQRLRFIHLNHSNPALWSDTPARAAVEKQGSGVALEGESWDL